MLVHNHVNGVFQACATRAPGFGDRRLRKLEDIATITGGQVYSRHAGFSLENMTLEQLGRARQVRVTADRTAIIDGAGVAGAGRVPAGAAAGRAGAGHLRHRRGRAHRADRLAVRARSPSIRVGAPTNAELAELQHRVEDALSATRAAMAEGIVAGGGVALMHAAPALDELDVEGRLRDRGGDRAPRADRADVPHRRQRGLPRAGGGRRGRADGPVDEGFDALEGRYGNMIEMGIIDPLRVCRSALENGASVAGLLLTTNTLIAEEQTPWGGSRALMTEFGAAGRGPAPALAGLEHAAVAGPRARRSDEAPARDGGQHDRDGSPPPPSCAGSSRRRRARLARPVRDLRGPADGAAVL